MSPAGNEKGLKLRCERALAIAAVALILAVPLR